MSHQDTKRIAKNTIFLYVRMIITMLITLYTSRVILNVLGVEDYGVYNIIAGIVVLLAFLQTAMTNASQRYITYELGKGELESVKKVFSMSMTTHITISLLIFFLAETIGLWLINTQLNAGSQLGVSIFDFDFYCKSYSYPLQCLHYCLRKYVILCLYQHYRIHS